MILETNRLKTYGDRELTQPANGSHLGGNTRCRMIGVLHQFVFHRFPGQCTITVSRTDIGNPTIPPKEVCEGW